MTQEGKQILLKDLCSRLPYGVKGLHRGQVHELFTIDSREANNACIQVDEYNAWFSIDTFKPYLRSLSSMTEEEKNECFGRTMTIDIVKTSQQVIDWLVRHHFDFRGLIPMKLALEAPADMYNF